MGKKIRNVEYFRFVRQLLFAGYKMENEKQVIVDSETRRDTELEKQVDGYGLSLLIRLDEPKSKQKIYRNHKTKLGGMAITAREERLFDEIKQQVFSDTYLPKGYRKRMPRLRFFNGKHLGGYVISERTKAILKDDDS